MHGGRVFNRIEDIRLEWKFLGYTLGLFTIALLMATMIGAFILVSILPLPAAILGIILMLALLLSTSRSPTLTSVPTSTTPSLTHGVGTYEGVSALSSGTTRSTTTRAARWYSVGGFVVDGTSSWLSAARY